MLNDFVCFLDIVLLLGLYRSDATIRIRLSVSADTCYKAPCTTIVSCLSAFRDKYIYGTPSWSYLNDRIIDSVGMDSCIITK